MELYRRTLLLRMPQRGRLSAAGWFWITYFVGLGWLVFG
jgi:hypothetical protein